MITFKEMKEIISPIPEEKFCANFLEHVGKCCFLGHINNHYFGKPSASLSGNGARELTTIFLLDYHGIRDRNGAHVNNNPNINGYTHPVIKDRLMAMIEDGIKWENKNK